MVEITSLWLPILLSTVFVFVLSSIIHMFIPYHKSDFTNVPSEDEVMDSLRKFNISPGDYVIPQAGSTKVMQSPEFAEKSKKGPVIFMTVMENGIPSLTGSLVMWFGFSLLVGVLSALAAGSAFRAGTHYHDVFHLVAIVAFAGYALALLQNSIWFKRKWSSTLKSMFDGLLFALLTAGTFGWLWPK